MSCGYDRELNFFDGYSMTRRGESDFKVVMLGESGVGKTSLVEQLYSGVFSGDVASTIGAAYFKSSIQVDDDLVTLAVWDTAGQEKFQSLTPLYLRKARGLVFVVDAAAENQIQGVTSVYDAVKEQIKPEMASVLCINKIDLTGSDIDISQYEIWARERGMGIARASAKTGAGVMELFVTVARLIKAGQVKDSTEDVVNEIVNVDNTRTQRESSQGCC